MSGKITNEELNHYKRLRLVFLTHELTIFLSFLFFFKAIEVEFHFGNIEKRVTSAGEKYRI